MSEFIELIVMAVFGFVSGMFYGLLKGQHEADQLNLTIANLLNKIRILEKRLKSD